MKIFFLTLICAVAATAASAQNFSDYFADRTLRIDYIFSGNAEAQLVALDELASEDGWAGRRVNLDTVPVRGNGDVKVAGNRRGSATDQKFRGYVPCAISQKGGFRRDNASE